MNDHRSPDRPAARAPARGGSGRTMLNLCLQGGGAHGAYTWGAIDRLLEDERIALEGLSGTSAGAVNAAVLADGLRRGGNPGGREALGRFWRELGQMPGLAAVSNPMVRRALGEWHLDNSPTYLAMDLISRLLSPYALNPSRFHPLRDILEAHVDFAALRAPEAPRVVVCATCVSTGQRRLFDNTSLSVEAVLASTCLPSLFPAIEIDGEALWDGGFTGNPPMYALHLRSLAEDFLIIRINPLRRAEIPTQARDIINRVNEVSFNATFVLELQTFALVQNLLREEGLGGHRLARLRLHCIEAEDALSTLGASSKLNNEPAFLEYLFDIGRRAADTWLAENRAGLGTRSTFDLTPLVTQLEHHTTPAV